MTRKGVISQAENVLVDDVGGYYTGEDVEAILQELGPAVAVGWVGYSAVTPTRASADDPTYVLTFASVDLTGIISVGMKLKWTQNSTVRYGIVTAISFSTNTTLTLYGGTDYDVDDTASFAISDFYYSSGKAPLSFPLDPDKWTVYTNDTSNRSQASPTANTWYNLGSLSITIPIGSWRTDYFALCQTVRASSVATMFSTLSTSNSSESDTEYTNEVVQNTTGATAISAFTSSARWKIINLGTKTVYYLNGMTNQASTTSIAFRGDLALTKIRCVCAYL